MIIKESRVQKSIINTIVGITAQLINLILSFGLRTTFIKTLGIQYTGVSSVFADILMMLSFSELGVGTAIATALYEPLKKGDKEYICCLMKFYKKAYRIVAALVFVLGLVALPFLDFIVNDVPDVKEDIRIIFFFFLLKTATSYLLIYKTTLMNADQKQYIVKWWETICILTKYIVEMVLLFMYKNYMLYLVIEVVATILQNIIVTNQVQKRYQYAFIKNDNSLKKNDTQKLLRDIKGLAMYQISGSIGNSIDGVMVSSLISTTLTGLLSNYTLIRRQVENIVKQFFNAIIPSIGDLATEHDENKQYIVFNRIFYVSFVIVNFCSTSLYVLFGTFISIWLGEQYVLEDKLSFIIAFDFFLYIILQAIASFRTANGLFVKGQYRPLITSILNIIFTFFFIHKWGVFGAIFATVLCRILTQWYDPFILYKYIFKKRFIFFYTKYWLYISIYVFNAIFTRYLSSFVMIENIIIRFLFQCVLCFVIPNVIVILFTFRTDEFRYFVKIVMTKTKYSLNKVKV